MGVKKNAKNNRCSDDIAIIGFSCRFPGAETIDHYWENLKNGVESVVTVPRERWNINDFYSNNIDDYLKTVSQKGGFIDGIELFDAKYFRIDENRALLMDPQQRLILESTAETINHAGYTRKELSASKTGVFIAANKGDYGYGNRFLSDDGKFILTDSRLLDERNGFIGNLPNIIAATVSNYFNFSGPSFIVSSMCSSSLVAVNVARQSLLRGESDLAIAGGIQLYTSPSSFIEASKTRTLSPDSKTRTFSQDANGYVLAEGVGTVLLKKLDNALRDNDSIYAIIKSSVVNNDGKTMSIVMPNVHAQKKLIAQALEDAAIDASSISYFEANGTAFELGDDLEVQAASHVYSQYSDKKQYCAIGSVEPNIGHALHAAGMASLMKVIVALQHKQIPPTINCERVNPKIKFEETPFFLNRETIEWKPVAGCRRAGISAFGFGGTNGHVIMEDFDAVKYDNYQAARKPLSPIAFNKKRLWLYDTITLPEHAKKNAATVGHDTDPPEGNAIVSPEQPQNIKESTLEYIKTVFSDILNLPKATFKNEETFENYGVESVSVLEITKKFAEDFGEIPSSLLFEYMSIDLLSDYFIEEHKERLQDVISAGRPSGHGLGATRNVEAAHAYAASLPVNGSPGQKNHPEKADLSAPSQDEDIAIIGVSGKYPQSDTLEQFWQNIISGKNCISEIPADRWDWRQYYNADRSAQGSIYSKWGGFINDVACFDPLFFNISPVEAEKMDPQERLFLEIVWSLFEDAGYTKKELSRFNNNVGVFVGVMNCDYEWYGAEAMSQGYMQGSHIAFWSIANRVSYYFNFQGPSLAVDTACSSSLTALHLACESIKRGECHTAIAGGVNLILHPAQYLRLSNANMMTQDNTCKSFGDNADGFVNGEGVGAVLLKPLRQAIHDNDNIYGVIKSTAINAGGKTSGFTVPNPNAQAHVIEASINKAGIDPRTISYLEAHGTGTSLGDPIEFRALKKVYQKYTSDTSFCSIGSLKSNIGHLQSAAGIASITKVLLQLKNKTLAPSLHSEKVNPQINFENSPFYLQHECAAWKQPELEGKQFPRRAGISAFGAGGANAHVIIEEYRHDQESYELQKDDRPYLFLFSAKNETQLKEYAARCSTFLEEKSGDPDYHIAAGDIAFTLHVGREHMEKRLAIVASGIAELITSLESYLHDAKEHDNIYSGSIDATGASRDVGTMLQASIASRDLKTLAGLWLQGTDLDWYSFNEGSDYTRISLPTYVFAREKYWVPRKKMSYNSAVGAVPGHLPVSMLLQYNTSDFYEQRFTSVFTGDELFLKDHVVHGKKMLPGTAYLEMARSAVSHALGTHEENSSGIMLRDIVWARPVVVDEQAVEVHIGLYPEEDGTIQFEIYGEAGDENTENVFFSQGSVKSIADETIGKKDLDTLQSRCSGKTYTAEECYTAFKSIGLDYGASHRAIDRLYVGDKEIVARLSLEDIDETSFEQYVLHPGMMDAALQASIGFMLSEDNVIPVLPFSVDEVIVHRQCRSRMWAHLTYNAAYTPGGRDHKLDIDLCDDEGNICVRVKGFLYKALAGDNVSEDTSRQEIGTLLLAPCWKEKPALVKEQRSQYEERLVILCELDKDFRETVTEGIPGVRCLQLYSKNKSDGARFIIHALQVFSEVQHYMQEAAAKKVLVQVVYSNETKGRIFAGLSGLLKTAEIENPHVICQSIEIDDVPEKIIERLQQNSEQPEDKEIRYYNGTRFVAGWQEVVPAKQLENLSWRNRGVYLITGGTGGLGYLFAKEIRAKIENPTIILTGRSELTAEKEQQLKELISSGAVVQYKQVDVTKAKAVTELIQNIMKEHGALHGIIHSAGIIKDNFIIKKTGKEFKEVTAPKITGVYNLDQATKDVDIDFMVFFSSVAGSIGNAGQADYATGNAFMDAYAAYRNKLVEDNQRYGKTLSLNWPLWKEGGMQVDAVTEEMLWHSLHMVPLLTTDGIEAFYQSFASGHEQVMVLQGSREKLSSRFLVAHQQEMSIEPSASSGKEEKSLNIREPEFEAKTLHYFKKILSDIIKLPAERIDADVQMEKYGIDSVMIMQMTTRLEKEFGSLSKTLFYEYQTIKALSGYFLSSYRTKLVALLGLKSSQETTDTKVTSGLQTASMPMPVKGLKSIRHARLHPTFTRSQGAYESGPLDIAIIGLAGRYPGARNVHEFWNNLKNAKDCITEIPASRWNYHLYFDADKSKSGKTYSKWGGFLEGIDEFDSLFFNVAPKDAELMDPQERLFLQSVYEAIEDAGYTRETLDRNVAPGSGGNVGVYVGVMYEEYQLYGAQRTIQGMPMGIAGSSSSIANRVSYIFNFRGPSMALDTMCSSSLTTVHLACQSLKRGECSVAIAGGVNLSIHPNKYLMLGQNKFLSSEGRCESFGEGGDGYVPGEGVGTVILKPLSAAIADGDHVYGVIKATAINHGGKTNGYTVPNPHAQSEVIERALTQGSIDPRAVSYIEAHGTGTVLGDPIEITGLNKAFSTYTADTQFCSIGSVKSNIGHCESAAGIAGITKVLLQFKHRQLVPSLHTDTLNPNIDFENSAFKVQRELTPWERPELMHNGVMREHPRLAGISAFGAGGANAHILIEEYAAPVAAEKKAADRSEAAIIVLSAKNEERLQEQVERLVVFIEEELAATADLREIAYTLQVGREAMEERLAMLVDSVEDLVQKCKEYLAGKDNIDSFYRGHAKHNKDALAVFAADEDIDQAVVAWIHKKKYTHILDLWVKGMSFDWNRLYDGDKPRRISLPSYPFARNRHWIPELTADNQRRTGGFLHPLLHQNTSDLTEQRFSSYFTGHEFFLADHVVEQHPILSGVAYLEMVREATVQATGCDDDPDIAITIKNITWTRPMVVNESAVQVHTGLYPEDDGQLSFEIYSIPEDNAGNTLVYSKGKVIVDNADTYEKLNIASLKEECDGKGLSPAECYAIFNEAGIRYGAGYQGIEQLYIGQEKVLAKLSLDPSVADTLHQYVLHPCLMDSALQASIGLMIDPKKNNLRKMVKPALLFAMEEVTILSSCTSSMWAMVTYQEGSSAGDTIQKVAIDLCDQEGHLCVRMRGVTSRVLEEGLKNNSAATIIEAMNPDKVTEYPEEIPSYVHDIQEYFALRHSATSRQRAINNIVYRELVSVLVKAIASLLFVAEDHIDPHENFNAYGCNLAVVNELISQLNQRYGLDLTIQSMADYNTIHLLTEFLLDTFPGFFQEEFTGDSVDLAAADTYLDEEYQRITDEVSPQIEEMNALLSRLLWEELQAAGICEQDRFTVATCKEKLSDMYYRWFDATLDIMKQKSYILNNEKEYVVQEGAPRDRQDAWNEWEEKKKTWLKNSHLEAMVQLVETTVKSLPQIITGKVPATDIMFPKSSMHLVEGIYKHNPIADYFNEVLSDAIVCYVQERIKQDASRKIRIFEIGAGTGGTSNAVFQKLQPYKHYIDEYCYTDISKAFLMHAEKTYGPHNPYLTYKIYNVEAPLSQKDIVWGSYDLVIATNVLHATKNINKTLLHGKALMRHNGLLLLNEISNSSLFTHLTFGLLEGWWLHEDEEIRIPGCPGLYPEAWQDVLQKQGYRSILFPAEQAHFLGQQIVVAESDGVVRIPQSLTNTVERERKSHRSPERDNMQAQGKERVTHAASVESNARTIGFAVTDQMTHNYVKDVILEKLSMSLKIESDDIDNAEQFSNYGVDSIIGVDLVQAINEQLHIELQSTDIFDYSSVNALTDYILVEYKDGLKQYLEKHRENKGEVAFQPAAGQQQKQKREAAPVYKHSGRFQSRRVERVTQVAEKAEHAEALSQKEPIAIIGVSGRFARSQNVAELWKHLVEGDDLVEEVKRWDLSTYYPDNRKFCNYGSFLDTIDEFDPLFFNISGVEATYMDPQQRIFLEECWKALEDAGYAGDAVKKSRCGVYAGCGVGDYHQLFDETPPPQAFWGNTDSIVPARIAYYLDLHGPAVAVDTACSSSLVAIHLACQSLQVRETDMALAGGIFVQCTPDFYLYSERVSLLSHEGRSFAFDERADGIVYGEGAGVIMLKRLQDALDDGDNIYGVIKGSALNQDGATNGITAPSLQSQERLEKYVYDTFEINPENIQMVEAHGTGTKLGDPIEFQALSRAFRHYTDKEHYCALSSIKSSMGHGVTVAGVAGILKIVQALKHRKIPPLLNYKEANSKIKLEGSPFYINTAPREWEVPQHSKRCAVISGFGFSGTNAHIAIEEAPAVERVHTEKPGYLIVLSARTADQLREQVLQFLEYSRNNPQLDCGNMSYTLLLGRKHMQHRLACNVRDQQELNRYLEKWLKKGKVSEVYHAELQDNDLRHEPALERYGNQCIQNCLAATNAEEYLEYLSALTSLYIQGYDLAFKELFAHEHYTRVSLPSYPFAREKYWVAQKSEQYLSLAFAPKKSEASTIHPLLHRNTSDFFEQRFTTLLDGKEMTVAVYREHGENFIAEVTCLEMVRAAVKESLGIPDGELLQLRMDQIDFPNRVLITRQPLSLDVRLVPGRNDSIDFEIYRIAENNTDQVTYARGSVVRTAAKEDSINIRNIQERCSEKIISSEESYAALSEAGIECGPSSGVIERIYSGNNSALIALRMPEDLVHMQQLLVLPPVMLDAAVQAMRSLITETHAAALHVVTGFERLELLHACTPVMWVEVRYSKDGDSYLCDMNFADETGNVCLSLAGLHLQQYSEKHDEEVYELLSFEETWQEEPLVQHPAFEVTTIVCFVTDNDYMQVITREINALNPHTKLIFIAQHDTYRKRAEHEYGVHLSEKQHYLQAMQDIKEQHGRIDAFLYQWELEDSRCIKDYAPIVYMLQAIAESSLPVTRVILAGQYSNGVDRCYLESWLGFERSLEIVLPRTQLTAVYKQAEKDDSSNNMSNWIDILWKELHSAKAQSALYEKDKRYVYKITNTRLNEVQSLLQPGKTYLITGGCGGLGLLFARYLAEKTSANLILTGRSSLDNDKQQALKKLEALGSEVFYLQADVSDMESMKEGLKAAKKRFGSIQGVIHSAGIESLHTIFEKELQDFNRVLQPKVEGTIVLDQLLADEKLDFTCYFSSASAIMGDFGACDYSVANRFLMAYARYRKSRQDEGTRFGRTIAINWPLWKDGGMFIGEDENNEMYLKTSGQRFLEKDEGLQVFEHLIAQDRLQQLILVGKAGRIDRFLQHIYDRPLITAAAPAGTHASGSGRRREMKGLSLEECLEWDLKDLVSRVLKLDRGKIDSNINLADYGFDSLSLADFAGTVSTHLGLDIKPTVFYSYATLEKLVPYFMEQHQAAIEVFYKEGEERDAVSERTAVERKTVPVVATRNVTRKHRFTPSRQEHNREPIAIIGMSGIFPGCRTISEMWSVLQQGEHMIRMTPADRFTDSTEERTQWRCGWIPGVREFDPLFFGISPREAMSMDPRQRLLLQEAWKALEDAGYGSVQISKRNIGMFVGAENGDYQDITGTGDDVPLTALHNGVLGARLSYFLNLNGPNLVLNTACSSGLVAAHQACLSLRNHECDTAIAAGVNLMLSPTVLRMTQTAGMLSEDGVCRAFDMQANGMVPGEAVVALVLKRLSQAEAEGDPIYAVIKGSNINYDGKTNGITAPNGAAQAELLHKTYEQYEIDPQDIEYIVTHGTGTKLGDPIEVNALNDVFKKYTDREHYCALTSAKTNFGHAFAASGLVSLVNLITSMRRETIPASLHFAHRNEYISWDKSPFYVNTENRKWLKQGGKNRLGAVSAFGMSGTNAHMVVESYDAAAATYPVQENPSYLLVFSAKSRESLQNTVKDMITVLETQTYSEKDLPAISYTLLEGRHHFDYRMAVVVKNIADALELLKKLDTGTTGPAFFEGEVSRNFKEQPIIKKTLEDYLAQSTVSRNNPQEYQKILYALADLYCQGYTCDGNDLFGGQLLQRLHLPAYSFSREEYWVPQKQHKVVTIRPQASENREASPQQAVVSNESNLQHRAVTEMPEKPDSIGLPVLSEAFTMTAHPLERKQHYVFLTGTDQVTHGEIPSLKKIEPVKVKESVRRSIEDELIQSLAETLAMDAGQLNTDTRFIDVGLDSIISVEWIKALNSTYAVDIPANIVYEYPTVHEFTGYLKQILPTDATGTETKEAAIESEALSQEQDVREHHQSGLSFEAALIQSLAETLAMDAARIDADTRFIDVGLDSIISVEWIKVLNSAYAVDIPANIVYEYPTVREFSNFLAGQLQAQEQSLPLGEMGKPDEELSLSDLVRQVHEGSIDVEQADTLLFKKE